MHIKSLYRFLYYIGLFCLLGATASAQSQEDNLPRRNNQSTLASPNAITTPLLAALKTPSTYWDRQTLIYHDGLAFVNAKGKSFQDVLTWLRQRPGLSGLTEEALKTAYSSLKESPIARIGSPEHSALSALYKLDLLTLTDINQLQALAKIHKKAEATPYIALHNRIWTLTDLPQLEQPALDKEIASLLVKLNLLKENPQSEKARRFRSIYGAHLVKSNGLSFNSPQAFNRYVNERTTLSFTPSPLRSFASLAREATADPDTVNTSYEGRGGKDKRKKTTSNFQHNMDILNGNDSHAYAQDNPNRRDFRQRYTRVSNDYNASLSSYLSLHAKELLRKEGFQEKQLHDILDHNGILLWPAAELEDVLHFYQLYGGRGWDGGALTPFAGNVSVQTRWGRKLDRLKEHYRAKSDAELVRAARKAEWEQLGVDILHNIPFVGHIFGVTEAALTGKTSSIVMNSLGLVTDYVSTLVPTLVDIRVSVEAAEAGVSSAVRNAGMAVEKRIAATIVPKKSVNAVPAEFSRLVVGESRSWEHPLTHELLTVTRLIDQEVVALRRHGGGKYIPIDFSIGKPNFAKVIFQDQDGKYYRGGLKGGGLTIPVVPLEARVNLAARFTTNRVDDQFIIEYAPTSKHYLRAQVDDGVFTFSIKSDPNTPEFGSGRDMFIGVMKRLRQERIEVKKIQALWAPGESVNYAAYVANKAAGMSPKNAALNTWTGKRAMEYGFNHVDWIEEGDELSNYVTVFFGRPTGVAPASSVNIIADFTSLRNSHDHISINYFPNPSHYFRGSVKSKVFEFEMMSGPNTPHLPSERDMFINALDYLRQEGIAVTKIKEQWQPEGLTSHENASNFDAYLANIAAGMSAENAALNTPAGRRATEFGFSLVGDVKRPSNSEIIATFEKPKTSNGSSNGWCCHQ